MTEIKVLDKGFVRLVDSMGNDSSVVQAARVSYGDGTKTVREDSRLIDYLYRNGHTSPFEQCLVGDTRIPTMPCKGATRKSYTMAQLAKAFAEKGRHNAWVKLVKIRTVNTDGTIVATKIKHVWSNGVKPVFKVTTDGPLARTVVATLDHPFLTPFGYQKLSRLMSGSAVMLNGTAPAAVQMNHLWNNGKTLPEIAAIVGTSPTTVFRHLRKLGIDTARRVGFERKERVIDGRSRARRTLGGHSACGVCGMPSADIHHLDKNSQNNDVGNLLPVCKECHKAFHNDPFHLRYYVGKIASIEYVGEEEVFDLETESDNHNFVAEGFVVHNCVFKFHLKLPIFLMRQIVRHRTARLNEQSGRYSEMGDEFFIPQPLEIKGQSTTNKQSSGALLGEFEQTEAVAIIEDTAKAVYDAYQKLLALGVSREDARMVLSLNIYTECYWQMDLNNLIKANGFLHQRLDSHAQWQVQEYAKAIAAMVKAKCPVSYAAFEEHTLGIAPK